MLGLRTLVVSRSKIPSHRAPLAAAEQFLNTAVVWQAESSRKHSGASIFDRRMDDSALVHKQQLLDVPLWQVHAC